jgi:two-component system, chemotaxis family, response regulator Rcp1
MLEHSSSPRRIVVIDDNPADTNLLRIAPEEAGSRLEVQVIADGMQALDYFENAAKAGLDCDLVLLDLNIPVIDGFEILKQVKSNRNLMKLPVIILSSSSSNNDIERCYQSGANSYLSKPSGLQEFIGLISGMVNYWLHCARLPARRAITQTSSQIS